MTCPRRGLSAVWVPRVFVGLVVDFSFSWRAFLTQRFSRGLGQRQEIRFAQQSLIDIATHGVLVQAAPSPRPDVDAFLASLSTAWKDGEARPTHRKQPNATHWWRTRVDPFADAWPVIEGWLIAEPSAPAYALMDRLAEKFPQAYASKAQLRTLQRRVKEWRAERAKEMILGRLFKSASPAAHV